MSGAGAGAGQQGRGAETQGPFQGSGPRLGALRLTLVALQAQFQPPLGVGAGAIEGVGVIL